MGLACVLLIKPLANIGNRCYCSRRSRERWARTLGELTFVSVYSSPCRRVYVYQAVKTIRRPSRLISIPLIRIFRKFPSAAAFVPSILPDYLLDDLGGRTICLEVGYDLLQHDRPEDAWTWLERALHVGSPSIDDYLLGTMCLYHGLGRFRDAMSLLTHANELGLTEAESFGLANCPYRVLDSVWARHVGHIATIDYVIKQGILEGRGREDTILYLPPRVRSQINSSWDRWQHAFDWWKMPLICPLTLPPCKLFTMTI